MAKPPHIPADIWANSEAIMAAVTEEISAMIKTGKAPPPEGLFVPALATALLAERTRAAGHALRGTSGTVAAHAIRAGLPL